METHETKYKQKAVNSFKTKFAIYLFNKTITKNLTTISQADFESFKITDDIVNIYTTEYWQEYKDKKKDFLKLNMMLPFVFLRWSMKQ